MTEAPPANSVLEDIVRRESRSFLIFVGESYPWTTSEEREALSQVQQLIEEEGKAASDLAQYLVRQRHMVPYLGSYPATYTNFGFVSLDHLLPLLVEEERRTIAELERDLHQLQDPGALLRVRAMLDMKRRHLQTLERLTAAHPEPAGRLK